MRASARDSRLEVRVSAAGLTSGKVAMLMIAGTCSNSSALLLGSIFGQVFEQINEIFGVLLFLRQDRLHQPARRRITRTDEIDHLAIALDRDALGHEIG